jgi:hypothetical protein
MRLTENKEVVGSDESFFEDDDGENPIQDLYSEKAGILDGGDDGEVDISSMAYQIWKNATQSDSKLKKIVEDLPDVVFASKAINVSTSSPEGALIFLKTRDGNDALARVNSQAEVVTQSPVAILRAAECLPEEVARRRAEWHHDVVGKGVAHIMREERSTHGALGRPSGARFKTYDRLKRLLDTNGANRDLFFTDLLVREIEKAMLDIYEYPLFQSSIDTINRQLKLGISDQDLAQLVIGLRNDGRLSMVQERNMSQTDVRIICSLGLRGDL